jgi:hypothetical protein
MVPDDLFRKMFWSRLANGARLGIIMVPDALIDPIGSMAYSAKIEMRVLICR